MTTTARDREFAAFVHEERALLQRCAYLLVGRRAPADDLVSATLADLYGRWPHTRTPRRDALRLLCTTDPSGLRLPWAPRARFELLDAGTATEAVDPVVTDLGRLPAEQRLVLVLERVAALPSVEIAAVAHVGVDEVLALSRAARAGLVAADPARADDAVLATQLARAVPADLREAHAADDLAHGRTLGRRRWARRALAGAAAVVLLVLAVTQLRPASTPESAPVPAATVTVTPGVASACDPAETACQATLVRAWRARMNEVVVRRLDPKGTYFNSTSFYARDQTEGLWQTKQGALALEVLSLDGATEVYLQIATSRAYAPRCGRATGNSCVSTRFMDGNRFILTESLDVAEGLEVQYRPDGQDVITVVARNTGNGKALPLTRGDLVALVQDDALRLPPL